MVNCDGPELVAFGHHSHGDVCATIEGGFRGVCVCVCADFKDGS